MDQYFNFWFDRKSRIQTESNRQRFDRRVKLLVNRNVVLTKSVDKLIEKMESPSQLADSKGEYKKEMAQAMFRETYSILNKYKSLWTQYRKDSNIRLHNRLSNEIAFLGTALRDIHSTAEIYLPSSIANRIHELVVEYDKFGNWLSTIGDHQGFTEAGEKIFEKTKKLLLEIKEYL